MDQSIGHGGTDLLQLSGHVSGVLPQLGLDALGCEQGIQQGFEVRSGHEVLCQAWQE